MEAKDEEGKKTPLATAVEDDTLKAIPYILSRGAKSGSEG